MDSPVRRPGRSRPGMRPLSRKPKQLDAEPAMFEPAGGGNGMLLPTARRRRVSKRRVPGAATTFTADVGIVEPVALETELDADAVRRAHEIAARLVLPPPRDRTDVERGPGPVTSVRYTGSGDDIDLDATLDALVANPVPAEDDIVVREPRSSRRSIVLAVDVSGSMRGERVRTAAATVGALTSRLADDDVAVVAFWSDAAVLARLGSRVPAAAILDTLLRIPARGLTNVAFPLQVARRELGRVMRRGSRVLLLSDCVHNAGPDPRTFAATLPRLDVLLDTSGEHDVVLARELARLGHGRLATARHHREVAPALRRLFA